MFQVKERHLVQKHVKNLKRAGLGKNYQRIVNELTNNPLSRTHHFEILENRRPRPNLYSKRITQTHRVVYSVDLTTQNVVIYSAWGHYASGNQSLIHHQL